MKQILLSGAIALMASSAQAACYAEYKAKRDNPLRLHYGVMQVDGAACPSRSAAQNIAAMRLAAAGWTLLNIVGLSETPPSAEMQANAGDHFLRY